MTVKQLVDQLSQLDQDKEVKFFSLIEKGRGCIWIEVEDCDIKTTEDGYYQLCVEGWDEEDGGHD